MKENMNGKEWTSLAGGFLPEDGKPVLVRTNTGRTIIATRQQTEWVSSESEPLRLPQVTHWRLIPIPLAPEEARKEAKLADHERRLLRIEKHLTTYICGTEGHGRGVLGCLDDEVSNDH